jgi:hypothetical protein
MKIKEAMAVTLALICALGSGCKLSEDKVVHKGSVPSGGREVFELFVDGSESSVQTIKVDVASYAGDCELEVENLSSGSLLVGTSLSGKNAAQENVPVRGSVLAYSGPAEGARFVLSKLPGEFVRVRVTISLKGYGGSGESYVVRVLWADGP